MERTKKTIQEYAAIFSQGVCPHELCVEALEALVRLAISEHIAVPMLGARADMERVAEIYAASRSLG